MSKSEVLTKALNDKYHGKNTPDTIKGGFDKRSGLLYEQHVVEYENYKNSLISYNIEVNKILNNESDEIKKHPEVQKDVVRQEKNIEKGFEVLARNGSLKLMKSANELSVL